MTQKQLEEINKIILDLDNWGYSELYLKWRDNKLVKISKTKEIKPCVTDDQLTFLKKGAILIEKII